MCCSAPISAPRSPRASPRRSGTGRYDKAITADEVKTVVATEVEKVLAPVAKPLVIDASQTPFVILVVGVNGSGKTTTIGKLAAKFAAEGRKVMLAAGDTFRAAAIEQLKIWGERTKCAGHRRRAGLGFRKPRLQCADGGEGAEARHAADRHRRPAAEQGRTDERTGKSRPRDPQGRRDRAACGAAGARCHGRAKRAVAGRGVSAPRASPAW